MIIGEFETKVTDKSRIALPKKFREELKGELILTQGYEGCMILVTTDQFLALTKEIVNGKFINDAVRDTTRFLIGSAHEIELDKQGRFVLPQSLKTFAHVEDEVVFVGLISWIEVWSKKQWLTRKQGISENAAVIAEKLSNNQKDIT